MKDHTVCDRMDVVYTNSVKLTALIADEAAANAVIDRYEGLWNSGESFTALFPAKRDGDTQEELDAAAKQLRNELRKVIEDHWMSSLSRDEVVSLCNLLLKTSRTARVQIVPDDDTSYGPYDIVRMWNYSHQGESNILPPDPDIG